MPPRKTQKKATAATRKSKVESKAEAKNTTKEHTPSPKAQDTEQATPTAAHKRKHSPSAASSPPSKVPKTSSSPPNQTFNTDTSKIISFLLSPAGLELCLNPISLPKTTTSPKVALKDYFSPNLTPFEHLVCAVVLSRPISHNLGQRTIATVLNEPWGWDCAQKILDAGKEDGDGKTGRLEAMEEARTQHRQKTASELGGMAMCVVDEKWDEEGDGGLKGLLEVVKGESGEDGLKEEIRRLVKGKVKGLGDTGLDIFLRRVQGCEGWEGVGWFVDGKTRDALVKVGLPGNAEGLRKLVGDKREDFVVVLERTLGIVLEGKQEELKKQA